MKQNARDTVYLTMLGYVSTLANRFTTDIYLA